MSENQIESKTTHTTAAPVPRLAYTMREAAESLGLSYISVHRLIKRGKLRSVGGMRTKVIPHSELVKFLSQ